MRHLRPLRAISDIPAVSRALRVVEPLSWITCYLATGVKESWCARAWRRRKDSRLARWWVRTFCPRHCSRVARHWHGRRLSPSRDKIGPPLHQDAPSVEKV